MNGGGRRVLVVGAGICGVTAALELRRRGWTVDLFDPGPIPHPDAASTDITKAVRMDYGDDEHYVAMMETAFPVWDRWNATWTEPPYHQDGFLLLSRDRMAPGGFEHDSHATLTRRGHHLERLDRDILSRRFPAWNPAPYADGYWNPRAGWAASGDVVRQLAGEARAAGVRIREGSPFERLVADGSRVRGIVAGGREHRGDIVLMAAGAWTGALLPWLQDVLWATGQPVLHFRPADPDRFRPPRFSVWGADISRTGWYGFPALADGTLKVGHHGRGRRVDPHAPRMVDPAWEDRTRQFFRETFPELVDAPLIRTRLCLYGDTFDGDFWIDHDPAREGLVVAAGDSGHGFKFAPILGDLIADVVERRPNPFAARFAWRDRGAPRREEARFDGTA